MNILPHSIRPAAKNAAIMQMITFWKKVACTINIRSTRDATVYQANLTKIPTAHSS